jgi:hypothetical protein
MNEYDRPIPVYLVEQNVCQKGSSRRFFGKWLNIGRYGPEPLIFYLLDLRLGVKYS